MGHKTTKDIKVKFYKPMALSSLIQELHIYNVLSEGHSKDVYEHLKRILNIMCKCVCMKELDSVS